MKDTLKYGLIGFAITPIIILLIIYLVIFLFLSLDKKSTWRGNFGHAYEILFGLIGLILSGLQNKNLQNNKNNI